MRFRVFIAAALAASFVSCTGDVAGPASEDVQSPSFSVADVSQGSSEGFWFLPPVARNRSAGDAVFDPDLDPAVQVCELDGNPSRIGNPVGWEQVACARDGSGAEIVVAAFEAGSAEVKTAFYRFRWDTERGAENLMTMDPESFYRINVLVGGRIIGFLDIDPQGRGSGARPRPNAVTFDDLYTFTVGSTIPVTFFATTQEAPLCAAPAALYVLQCTTGTVVGADGGVITLEPTDELWPRMSTVVRPASLPAGFPSVLLTMERIDPALYLQVTGQECIPGLPGFPGFDAPVFGQCLRVSTDPVITAPLDLAANIEICVDPFVLDGIKYDEEQDGRLQIIRVEGGATQGLPNVDATTCGAPPTPGPDVVGLLPVPADDGPLRTAAIAVNTVARWFAPTALMAHGQIRLAGATTEFSNFQWGLPGSMLKETGDSRVIQQLEDGSESYDVAVEVRVVDSGAEAPAPSNIEGATVHFDGPTSVTPADVTTGFDGIAATTWSVPMTPGEHTLDARALGLLAEPVPDHEFLVDFEEETVQFSATVVGPPETSSQEPTEIPTTGEPGDTFENPLEIIVLDEFDRPVIGWPVTWTTTCDAVDQSLCDGVVEGDAFTDEDGRATAFWTLATVPSLNTATARVGSVAFDFIAGLWTADTGCHVEVDGVVSEGEWDCAARRWTFLANTGNGSTAPADVRWFHDGENLHMLVRIQQSSPAFFNSLRVDFDNTLNGMTADDDVIGFYPVPGSTTGVFRDEYMTEPCITGWGQFGCGVADEVGGGSSDGAGAMGNDGTYTVYELSHPLVADPEQDYELSANNPTIGFFLTLRVGEGLDGRSKYPAFRQYRRVDFFQ